MQKYGFTYIWFDKKHKRFYIGCHWGTEDDGYICSSNWMRDAYRRRPEDFKRRIIQKGFVDRTDLHEAEFKLLSKIKDDELGVRYYNVRKCHFSHWTTKSNAKKIAKRCAWQVGLPSEQQPRFGKPCLEETRKKISEKLKGRKWPEGSRKKRRKHKRGKYKTYRGVAR